MGYAFISYSSKNMEKATAVKSLLNKIGVNTWMAPFDIPGGSKYASEITRAIRECSCFVLLLTKESQASEAVDSEVELAVIKYKRELVTIKLEELELNDSFTFYLNNKQIIAVNEISENSLDMKNALYIISEKVNDLAEADDEDGTAAVDEKVAEPAFSEKDEPKVVEVNNGSGITANIILQKGEKINISKKVLSHNKVCLLSGQQFSLRIKDKEFKNVHWEIDDVSGCSVKIGRSGRKCTIKTSKNKVGTYRVWCVNNDDGSADCCEITVKRNEVFRIVRSIMPLVTAILFAVSWGTFEIAFESVAICFVIFGIILLNVAFYLYDIFKKPKGTYKPIIISCIALVVALVAAIVCIGMTIDYFNYCRY